MGLSVSAGGGERPPFAGRPSEEVAWHDLECGAYRADLPLWRELAAEAGSPHARVLEIGAGTGRVALDLARRGHTVIAIDVSPVLLGALRERAAGETVQAICADARGFELPGVELSLCLVPMQTVQLLGGPAGRAAFLKRARAHLPPGATLACAIVTELEPFDCAAGEPGPSTESLLLDGHLFLSRATGVRLTPTVAILERERRIVAPGGRSRTCAPDVIELDRLDPSRLEREALAAGLSPAGRAEIPATEEHVGSAVVILRA